ncbi:MAG: methyltransferase domain-containing protein [bacterium]
MKEDKNRVCPVELAGSLDNKLRRWVQNPNKILAPYIKEGMKVLDIGCGPGFFSIEAAMMVGKTGKVYAADMQEGMLQKIKTKIQGTALEQIVVLHITGQDKINLPEKVDFILVFYMLHEVPGKEKFFMELKNTLANSGKIFIVEPLGHVTKKDFEFSMNLARNAGFSVEQGFKLSIGRIAILTHA